MLRLLYVKVCEVNDMNNKVKNFIDAIKNGTDVETAIKETGVNKMRTYDVLIEIAKEFK